MALPLKRTKPRGPVPQPADRRRIGSNQARRPETGRTLNWRTAEICPMEGKQLNLPEQRCRKPRRLHLPEPPPDQTRRPLRRACRFFS